MYPLRSGPTSSAGAPDGRTRLLDAAERLLGESGIDGTTATEITHAAGHRNAAAVGSHPGAVGPRAQPELGVLCWPNGVDIDAELLRYDDLWESVVDLARVT
ncbi:MAG: TetR/AcrR family transcriptional regulator [Microthrixaceae bacterium]